MVLCKRKWIQTEGSESFEDSSKQQIYFYDGGDYIGWLLPSGVWSCWHVLARQQDSHGYVEELLEQMPEDWCPFFIASVECYSLVSEMYGVLEIPGWRIETLPLNVL